LIRRLALVAQLASIVGMWILSSQVWASANITETNKPVQVSGLEAYPQLSITLVVWLLICFVSGYAKSLFPRFILSAISIFTVSIQAPVWFESASGSLAVLGTSVAKITGVSDWEAQQNLIDAGFYNHFAADLFVILLIICFIATITRIWARTSAAKSTPLTTRIDDLPNW